MNEQIVFTPEQIAQVRESMRRARRDVEEWAKRATPTKEQMQQQINQFRNGKRVL